MKINILGSHGSDLLVKDGRRGHSCRSVGLLINDRLLLDAGTAASELTIEQQQSLEHVLISHYHLDHVKELPSLADNLVTMIQRPLIVASVVPVLRGLKAHIFNEQIFPNFFRIPCPDDPVLQEYPLEPEKEIWISDLGITPIPVNHSVPTVGFIIRDHRSAFVYSGDTYSTETIWSMAAKLPTLKAAFIETSFPDEMGELARTTNHLTPALLLREFQKIGNPALPIFAYHIKPPFRERTIEQLHHLGLPNLTILQEGQELHL